MSIAIQCSHLKKSFFVGDQETKALRGVNLTVPSGNFFMIVGPSGCGKTTLLSIIAGILHPDEGDCLIEGQLLSEMKPDALIGFRGQKIGFVFQSFNLIPTLSVAQNVAVPLIINGCPYDEAIEQACDQLAKVGLEGRDKQPPNQLSGGQQQRVAIARALIHSPRVLICDEPTSALDHDTGEKIMTIMREINSASKTTFVIVTHDSRIFHYADTIAHMDDGLVVDIKGESKC